MHCQKCRAPLKLHSTLETLNPASFNLLVDSTPPPTGPTLPTRPPYPPEQRKPYDDATKSTTARSNRSRSSSSQHVSNPPSPTSSRSTGDKGAMSFINITDSQVVPPSIAHAHTPQTPPRKNRGWSHKSNNNATSPARVSQDSSLSSKMETSMRLFEVLSSRTDIDHPVCTECTDLLINGLEKRLASASKERDAYVDFLRQAQANMPTEEEAEQTAAELAKVRKQEEAALAELEELEKEKASLESELRDLEVEAKELDKEEESFWRSRNAAEADVRALQEEQDSLELRVAHDEQLLQQLRRVNVYNDAFHISHAGDKGVFATINGLRLGRTASEPVEWAEINAAWGMTCLLLATVADKLGFEFKGYRLRPMGSASSIDEMKIQQQSTPRGSIAGSVGSNASEQGKTKTTTTNLPLYYASDLPISLPFMHRSFSDAMVAFCECVRQLGAHVAKMTRDRSGSALQLHYIIEKDKLWKRTDPKEKTLSSIRLGSNYDEWTRACKYTLTNCKILLACALHEEQREEAAAQKQSGEQGGSAG